jgi:hypothetical protein
VFGSPWNASLSDQKTNVQPTEQLTNISQEMFFCFHQGVEFGCTVDAVACCGGGNGGPGAAMRKRLVDTVDWGAEGVLGI